MAHNAAAGTAYQSHGQQVEGREDDSIRIHFP